jgi:hypothetical protein
MVREHSMSSSASTRIGYAKTRERTHPRPSRFVPISGVLLAVAIVLCGTGTAVYASTTPAPPVPKGTPAAGWFFATMSAGGRSATVPASALAETAITRAHYSNAPAALPSCRHITYRGNAGYIAVQTSKSGYVAWGIYMYNPKLDAGPWNVNVYVGTRRVDHKEQNYAPHGSVNPKDAKKGKAFHISATHTAIANHEKYVNVRNECIIP